MPSLYERLKSAGAGGTRARPRRADVACLVREALHPRTRTLRPLIPGETLHLMTGAEACADLPPDALLFLDTETTGLAGGAGTLAFLVGIGRFHEDGFHLVQYLMRDYDEEADLLRKLEEELERSQALVTFNGASFDIPLLESRFVMHRRPTAIRSLLHIDLVHVARRVYRMRLNSCTLSTLEKEVLNLVRDDDLPGAWVPERYFAYLRSGEEALLEGILSHNAQDILSMAGLYDVLFALHDRPLTASSEEELFSLGRVFEKRGAALRAEPCYRALRQPRLKDEATFRLAEIFRKQQKNAEAEAEYRSLMRPGPIGVRACIALSKICEHRYRDPERAFALARRGMLYCLAQPAGVENLSREIEDLQKRLARLARKTGGKLDGDPVKLENPRSPAQTAKGAG